ncbi:MAG: translation elongation factor Ts, partial [Verrucomicrobiota bacterium]
MAKITSDMVKTLRDQTGAGMMDCKQALAAADGNMEKAVDQLRKTGAAKAAKKAGRSTKEGTIKVSTGNNAAAMVEVLCETDFAAKNTHFDNYVTGLSERVLKEYNGEQDLTSELPDLEKDHVAELVGKIGENIQPRRAIRWEGDGVFASYLHMGGKIAVLAEITGEDISDELATD